MTPYKGLQQDYVGYTPGYSPADKGHNLVTTDVGQDRLSKLKTPYNPYGLIQSKPSGDLDIIVNMLKDRRMEETKRNLLNIPTEE